MADVKDKVKRIYPDEKGLNIRHMKMKKGYFVLKKTHPNYDALVAVALLAASHRYPLRIRTKDDNKTVQYLVIEW